MCCPRVFALRECLDERVDRIDLGVVRGGEISYRSGQFWQPSDVLGKDETSMGWSEVLS